MDCGEQRAVVAFQKWYTCLILKVADMFLEKGRKFVHSQVKAFKSVFYLVLESIEY